MDNIMPTISTTIFLFGFFTSTIAFIIKFIRAVKSKNKQEAMRLLRIGAEQAVLFVEQVKSKENNSLGGATKLTMALTQINQYCIDNGIKYNKDEAVKIVEDIISLTKSVNQREQDKIIVSEVAL